jgi:hypothetical protein
VSLEADPAALRSAGQVWQEQGERLLGASACLDDVDPAAVGERAAPALEVFAEHWAERVRTLRSTSHEHGSALAGAAAELVEADELPAAELATLRGLLERGS